MSDLLSIGASGVNAYQTALSAIGQNVSNATNWLRVRLLPRDVYGLESLLLVSAQLLA